MILQCPACETKFLVDASLIPPAGREVKCARCAHEWHVMGEASAGPVISDDEPALAFEPMSAVGADNADPEAKSESSSFERIGNAAETVLASSDDYDIPLSPHIPLLPETPPSAMPRLVLAMVLLVICIVLALIAFRQAMPSALAPVYDLIGMPQTDGMALADIDFRTRGTRTKTNYVVEGKIVNESSEIRAVPVLRVSLVDAEGEVLLSREYEADGAELAPGASYPFKATKLETAFGDRVDHLVVEIGNGVELMLRK